ncbi:MAG TPA: TlpA disulfide reductase family protein [Acidimicrobiia bacterium]|nr:TlpA disulfide reductase family protein [Acidimicrobiia bacterium]
MASTEPASPLPSRAGLSGGWLSALFVVVIVIGVAVAILTGDEEAAEVGRPAPGLAVTLFNGEVFDLVDHVDRGRGPVLLNLWASWCEPCTREFPALSAFAEGHPEVTVVGVAVQDPEANARAFVEEMDPSFAVGWDRDGAVRQAYPSFGLPATFLIGADGIITDVILAELTPERLESLDFG